MTDLARVKVSVCRMWTDWMTDLAYNIPTDSNPDFAIHIQRAYVGASTVGVGVRAI